MNWIKDKWGFRDAESIQNPDARAALAHDIAYGDKSATMQTFGYTHLFQPTRAVTRFQAATALVSAGASEGAAEAEAEAREADKVSAIAQQREEKVEEESVAGAMAAGEVAEEEEEEEEEPIVTLAEVLFRKVEVQIT